MSFIKCDHLILDSSVWREPMHVKIVWLTMLLTCDQDGFVGAAVPGLASRADVSVPQCQEALEVLSSPDPFSRTKDHDGRRITDIDGGWVLVNHAKYREKQHSSTERVRRHRAKNKRNEADVTDVTDVTLRNVTETDVTLQKLSETYEDVYEDQKEEEKRAARQAETAANAEVNEIKNPTKKPMKIPYAELVALWNESAPLAGYPARTRPLTGNKTLMTSIRARWYEKNHETKQSKGSLEYWAAVFAHLRDKCGWLRANRLRQTSFGWVFVTQKKTGEKHDEMILSGFYDDDHTEAGPRRGAGLGIV